MKGLIAVIAGAAAITAIFVFGANMMLDGVDEQRGKKKASNTAVVTTTSTENTYSIHDAFEENGM